MTKQATPTHLTPSALEVLLHYHYSPVEHPRIDVLAVESAIADFYEMGVLESVVPNKYDDASWKLTTKGDVWLKKILATPCPVQKVIWE